MAENSKVRRRPSGKKVIIMRDRSQALVLKGKTILLVRHRMEGREFFALPGGGIEEGETPEAAAIRELEEETCIRGAVIRPLSVQYKPSGAAVYTFLCSVKEDALPGVGCDPELGPDAQTIKGAAYVEYSSLSEFDRVQLWSAGLYRTETFHTRGPY